jgi:hypothetical protein
MHIQRNSQAISSALNNIAATSQQINQNVLDVIAAGPSVSEPLETAKRKRGRPPKICSNSARFIYWSCSGIFKKSCFYTSSKEISSKK